MQVRARRSQLRDLRRKGIGGACYDLLTKEGLLDQVKAEFAENKKKNQ